MIRIIDFCFSFFGLVLLFPLLLIVFFVAWFDDRSPIFCQERVGRLKMPFVLVKFRNMRRFTVSVATHLADSSSITPFGGF